MLDRYAASMRISAIRMNSDGLSWNPSTENDRWAPRAACPTCGSFTTISVSTKNA